MVTQIVAVVGGKDDHCFVDGPVCFQSVEDSPDMVAHQADHPVVDGAQRPGLVGTHVWPDLHVPPRFFPQLGVVTIEGTTRKAGVELRMRIEVWWRDGSRHGRGVVLRCPWFGCDIRIVRVLEA